MTTVLRLLLALVLVAVVAPRDVQQRTLRVFVPSPIGFPTMASRTEAAGRLPASSPAPSAKPVEPGTSSRATTQVGPKPGRTSAPARTARPTVRQLRTAQPTTASQLRGTASWYCQPGRSACTAGYSSDGAYAAAGPALRAALGPSWRGSVVTVTTRTASVRVRLIDVCGCPGGRLLDLYSAVFAQLAPHGLSDGLVDVEVTWP